MEFVTDGGGKIQFDPYSQQSIDAAKAVAPGQGIGPTVAGELMTAIAEGRITKTSQLPSEYLLLGRVMRLPD
jgi:hypothetical protein